ncbi:Inositol 2-dehydrogenase [Verticillium dahliae VDG2]|nr:Inositol 2-dehydrogenase [Verticillium dahliae VDG2]
MTPSLTLKVRLAVYFPLVGLINLFLHVVQNPLSSATKSDIALMDVVVGHFSYLDFASGSELGTQFPREVVAYAREFSDERTSQEIKIHDFWMHDIFGIGSADPSPDYFMSSNIAPGSVSGDTFIHDPTVVKTPSGGYLAAFTADNRDAGSAFPNGASWTTPYTKSEKNLWASDLSYRDGLYHLYYSASSFGTSRSAIFYATSPTGASGSWTDKGLGRIWMSFGSFWSGIKMIRIDPRTGKRMGSDFHSLASRPANGGAVEAPVIVYRNGYYFLWVSFDSCCKGAASTYRIMVGRSKSITGPYVDKAGKQMMQGGGTQMMSSHGTTHGPGHNAVLADGDGDVFLYHYYRNDGVAQIGINRLRYTNGWPVVF